MPATPAKNVGPLKTARTVAKGVHEPDTSMLFEQLQHEFHKSRHPITVDFRKLVDWIRIGDQETHLLHPYPAKLLPHIAHFFINASVLSRQDSIVLDPFCGSGTVALEASLAGRTPYIADANPMALLITRVKTRAYKPQTLHTQAKEICARARRYRVATTIPIINEHLWYSKETKYQLELLLRSVRETTPSSIQEFFLLCFSVLARRVSNADPNISVPVRLKVKDALPEPIKTRIRERIKWLAEVNVIDEFLRICEWNIQRVTEANLTNPRRQQAKIAGNDARKLTSPHRKKQLEDNSIPLIITSPPYGSAQKYIRATSLSLNWLQMAGPDELKHLEAKSIGREHLPSHLTKTTEHPLPTHFESILRKVEKINTTRASITKTYLSEMHSTLQELARVVSPGGYIVLIIGNNEVCGEIVRNDHYFSHILEDLGLKLRLSLLDDIKSRGLMTKRNRTASIISRESVLVFQKPIDK